MKFLIVAGLLLLLLAACYHQQKTTDVAASPGEPGIMAVATLSDSGDVLDMSASVVYTKLGIFRYRVAHALRRGVINVQQAEDWQYAADVIRRKLDIAKADRKIIAIQTASGEIEREMKQLETLYATH